MVYIILRYARIAIELELWPSMIKRSAAVPVAGIVSKMLRFFFLLSFQWKIPKSSQKSLNKF